MEPIRYVNIASYATGPEAHIVRNELEAAGIPAQVIGEAAVNAIWYVGTALGGVKVMVAEKDVPAARKILAELDLLSAPIDENFDGYDEADESHDASDEPRDDDAHDPLSAANPYRSPRAIAQADERMDNNGDDADVALVNRIWRSAVFGVVFCPPLLNCYSIWQLLANTDLGQRIPPKHRWKLWGAAAFNVFVVGMFILVAWSIYHAVNSPPPVPTDGEPYTRERSWP